MNFSTVARDYTPLRCVAAISVDLSAANDLSIIHSHQVKKFTSLHRPLTKKCKRSFSAQVSKAMTGNSWGCGSCVEQDSTMGPKFAFRSFAPHGILLGSAFPKPCCCSAFAEADSFAVIKNHERSFRLCPKPTTHPSAAIS